jgi:hypothetical protein
MGALITSSGTAMSVLNIYQGAVPTFATLTDYSTRASDLLVTFNITGATSYSNLHLVGNQYRMILGINGTPKAASASGIATWFLLIRSSGPAGVAVNTTLTLDRAAMMGTVGLGGSGADIEVGDTDIVAGVNYTSTGIYFNFPVSWTV